MFPVTDRLTCFRSRTDLRVSGHGQTDTHHTGSGIVVLLLSAKVATKKLNVETVMPEEESPIRALKYNSPTREVCAAEWQLLHGLLSFQPLF